MANFEKAEDGPQIRLSTSKVLKITEEDVHNLPMGKVKIDIDNCPNETIDRLKKELGVAEPHSRTIDMKVLDELLFTLKDGKALTKAAIIYIIYCLLCLSNGNSASLEYALILEDEENISSYNWCEHVLEHAVVGTNGNQILNPTADFHFILINYLDRMGKNCPFVTGKYKYPSMKGWDVKKSWADLAAVEKVVGYEAAIAVGYTKERKKEDKPIILPFTPENCPIQKVLKNITFCKNHIEYSQTQIEFYNECLLTLQGRISNIGEPSKDGEDTQQCLEREVRQNDEANMFETVNEVTIDNSNSSPQVYVQNTIL